MRTFIHFMVACVVALPLFGGVTWDELSPKVMNKTVVVEDNTGTKHKGELQELNAEGLAIRMKNGERVPFRRADVKKIQVKSRAKGAMWGAIVGGGIGGGIGAAGYRSFENEGGEAAGFMALLAGLGAGIGAGLGAAGGVMDTVYKAPSEESASVSPAPLREDWRPYTFREGSSAPKAQPVAQQAAQIEAGVPAYLTAER